MAGRRQTGLAAAAGLVAGVVTIGVGSLVALFTGPSSDPLVAVGSAFIDATPAWLKEFATTNFGTNDKLVLTLGEVVVLLALAALAGVLAAPQVGVGCDARRRARRGLRPRRGAPARGRGAGGAPERRRDAWPACGRCGS